VVLQPVRLAARFIGECGRLAVHRKLPTRELLLRAAYRAFLKREPDPEGLDTYLQALSDKRMTCRDILSAIVRSDEFREVDGLRKHPLDALHEARLELVRERLPKADVIVDLGGASRGDPEGALMVMGYPYSPTEIVIIDLPPDVRIGDSQSWETRKEVRTRAGTRIRYLYGSMADLSRIPDASADMVFSGESIEHVSETDGDAVCREAFRVLKPGAFFCLDTPNGALTRLQSPTELIHPEHQVEYRASELKSKLEKAGFEIVEALGICPMPETRRTGIFDARELVDNVGLSNNPEDGYLFYFKARKPLPA
jgi:SAM-dependent methyltransferase